MTSILVFSNDSLLIYQASGSGVIGTRLFDG